VLLQRSRVEVPGSDAFVAHVAMRHPDFGIGVMRSSGLVTDWGIQSELVEYIAHQRRTQLSILLAGRGYFMLGERPLLLQPGDVIETDQRRHDMEGYGGSPCEVIILDWEAGSFLGPGHQGETRHSRVGSHDVERLRALVDRVFATPGERLAMELIADLRALGLAAPRDRIAPVVPSPKQSRLYAALGEARAQLRKQPALPEIADTLELSERQVRRCLADLDRDFALNSNGWRDFVSDARLGYAQQLLSIPSMTIARAAELSGFRSQIALSHAFSLRAGITPGQVVRRLRERWG
jgi:AraC-like DNA-binding protein